VTSEETVDVVLIGGGIMSATLGSLISQLQPDWSIRVYERLGEVAQESSNAWNNAGTGHAALCELNYMPEAEDGTVDPAKAIQINEQFQVSRQYWSYLVSIGALPDPERFINPTPHMTFVKGKANVEYLRKRYEALKDHPLFSDMEYTEDLERIAEWTPLIAKKRNPKQRVAATRSASGTDVDFGALTKFLFQDLERRGASVQTNHQVTWLNRRKDGMWHLRVRHTVGQTPKTVNARFVFVGAGGGALALLQHSGIKEIEGYGGFPISGQFLRTTNPRVVAQHQAKVYGKAAVGAPPMSVPHLDTRVIDGKRSLLFGPYAGFSTKYLKEGSLLDFPMSLRLDNLIPMMAAGARNIDLTKYLIGQVLQSPQERLNALNEFMPTAKMEDWQLAEAGQRVQVIKKDKKKGGILQFGTEVVTAKDGSIAALLGASPGASTAVEIMLRVIAKCFPEEIKTPAWQEKLQHLIPSYGQSLEKNPELYAKTRQWTAEKLGLL